MMASGDCDMTQNNLFVNFNQDSTSICVGTEKGFRLVDFQSIDDFRIISRSENEEIHIAERCFSTNIVAYVALQSPRKLNFLHVERDVPVCDPRCYNNSILNIKLNRKRVVVVLEEFIYIHDGLCGNFMEDLHRIKTPINSKGLCALSHNDQNGLIAYPGEPNTGQLYVFDGNKLQDKIVIPAHENPLSAMTFDPNGEKIATASEKGTIIRVHSIANGCCLWEFRRGLTRCANIYSLSFGFNSLFLCASSSTETIHIFKLEPVQVKDDSWFDYIGQATESYLPTNIIKILNQERSFAYARLPLKGCKTVSAIATINNEPWLLVASHDGYIYIYGLNATEGGECNLVRQHKLKDLPQYKPERRDSIPTLVLTDQVATLDITNMD